MNALSRRLKRLEDLAAEAMGEKRIAFAWAELGETEEEALARWKAENAGEDPESATVLVVGWAQTDTWPSQGREGERNFAPTSIEDEIESLYGELAEAGFTREEVTSMVVDAPSFEELKSEELSRLFSGRPRR